MKVVHFDFMNKKIKKLEIVVELVEKIKMCEKRERARERERKKKTKRANELLKSSSENL
jgi:hypothetical protein